MRTQDADFRTLLENRYVGFMRPASASTSFSFDIDVVRPERNISEAEDLRVWTDQGIWHLERGDFRAHWDPRKGRWPHPAILEPVCH